MARMTALGVCVLVFGGVAVASAIAQSGEARDKTQDKAQDKAQGKAQNKAQGKAGQEQDVPVNSGPVNAGPGQEIHTLHVYANLIQIPVLVLGPRRETVAPVAANRFRVSIDGGPLYKVTHVRMEGDDPISLAILLDLRGPEDDLMQKMESAMAGLVPGSLHAKDRVSIYALGCNLQRSVNDAIASKVALQGGVDALLRESMSEKRERRKGNCKDEWHLWDALGTVVEGLSEVPGRRVVLAVTNGEDRGSRSKWNQVTQLAQSSGVAVFGIARQRNYPGVYLGKSYEDLFDGLCQLSGGLAMTANSENLADRLVQFVKMVRGRYIVEFPRPYNSTAGSHHLAITIQKSDDFIRPAGISVPIADPAVMADPTTVPSDPSLTPQEGKRRILPQK